MIIFINGSINSGKSTVAKLLAEKLGNTAIVEIDALRTFIDWMPIDTAVPLNLENAVSVILNFAQHGLHIIIPYPLSKKNYEYLMSNLNEFGNQIRTYTLDLKLENAQTNRGTRELTDWERARIEHHYAIGINNPDFGVVLGTDGKTPEEVTELVLADLEKR